MGGLVFEYQYGLFSPFGIVRALLVPVIVFYLSRLFAISPFHIFGHLH
jgi:hypothetical protein